MSKVVLCYFSFTLKLININNSNNMNCNFNKCIINNYISLENFIMCIKTIIQILIEGTKSILTIYIFIFWHLPISNICIIILKIDN